MLRAEVTFAEWTPDGQVRHACFMGMLDDKPAKAIVREEPKLIEEPQETAKARSKRTTSTTTENSIKVSHGGRSSTRPASPTPTWCANTSRSPSSSGRT